MIIEFPAFFNVYIQFKYKMEFPAEPAMNSDFKFTDKNSDIQ